MGHDAVVANGLSTDIIDGYLMLSTRGCRTRDDPNLRTICPDIDVLLPVGLRGYGYCEDATRPELTPDVNHRRAMHMEWRVSRCV